MRLAILDDYAHLALQLADWSPLEGRCLIEVFDKPMGGDHSAIQKLARFDIICHVRERMAMPATIIDQLPNLKFMTITGREHRTLDVAAAARRGVIISGSSGRGSARNGTPELAWGLALCVARQISLEDRLMRSGGWQHTAGMVLNEKTLGLLGLGVTGKRMAQYGVAFGMEVIAWSQNLTTETAASAGVTRVEKEELLRRSDVLSIHLVLGDRSRGLVGAEQLALMKPTSILINTSRGPIVDEAALISALSKKQIRGAGLDVYNLEPLPDDSPLRKLDNVVLTPHLGYASEDGLRIFYEDTVEAIIAFLDGKPIRVVEPPISAPRK
jgi:phosphoglycerate dehydrogenase-like enzyme